MEARADSLDELGEMGVLSLAGGISRTAAEGPRPNEVEALLAELRECLIPVTVG